MRTCQGVRSPPAEPVGVRALRRRLRLAVGSAPGLKQGDEEAFLARMRETEHLAPAPDHGMLAYKPDALGDFILALPALRALRAARKGTLVLATSRSVEELARRELPGWEVMGFPPVRAGSETGGRADLDALAQCAARYRGWDLVSFLHVLTFRDVGFFRMMGPGRSFGLNGSPLQTTSPGTAFPWEWSDGAPYPPAAETGFPIELHAHFQAASLAAERVFEPELPTLTSFVCRDGDPHLLVFPATKSRLRNYPVDRLARAILASFGRSPARVTVAGLPLEAAAIDHLVECLERGGAHPVSRVFPSATLDMIDLVASSSLVVSMDSGPAHVAAALDKPGVFLLGGGQFGFFGPWSRSPRQRWLNQRASCYGCNWLCPLPEAVCVTGIAEEAIVSALDAVRLSD